MRIPLTTVLVTLACVAIVAGVAVGIVAWQPWDSDGGGAATQFTMTLETSNDFREAAQRMGSFMSDFACEGQWDEELRTGILGCDAGLAGFTCQLESPPKVVCKGGEQLSPGFAACAVEGSLVQCSGPNTNAFCRVGYDGPQMAFVVTCQKGDSGELVTGLQEAQNDTAETPGISGGEAEAIAIKHIEDMASGLGYAFLHYSESEPNWA